MNESTKDMLKTLSINVTSLGGITASWMGLYYGGILESLTEIYLFEYNLVQFIFLCLISMTLGSIFYPVITKQKSTEEGLKEAEQFLKDTLQTTDAQWEHTKDELKQEYTEKAKGIFAVFRRKKSKSRSPDEIVLSNVPHPNSIRTGFMKLQKDLVISINGMKSNNKQYGVFAVTSSDESGTMDLGPVIPVKKPISANIKNLQPYGEYRRRGALALLVILGIAAISYLVVFLVQNL